MMRPWISILKLAGAAFLSAALFAESPNPELSRAQALYRQTEYGRAIDAAQALGQKDAAAYALLGKAHYMQGHYKQAVMNLEKAVADDNRNSDYYDWLGKAFGRQAESSSFVSALGYAKQTLHAFEHAVELDSSNLEALSDLFEYYLDAPGIVGGGLDKADALGRRFAELDEAEYHWVRARLAEKRKDFAAAEREFRAASALAPGQVGRELDLAVFLSARGRYAESDAIFQSAAEKHPDSANALYARAAAHIQARRKLDEAQSLLEKYLELRTTPDDPSPKEAAALLGRARSLGSKSQERPRIQGNALLSAQK